MNKFFQFVVAFVCLFVAACGGAPEEPAEEVFSVSPSFSPEQADVIAASLERFFQEHPECARKVVIGEPADILPNTCTGPDQRFSTCPYYVTDGARLTLATDTTTAELNWATSQGMHDVCGVLEAQALDAP